MSHRMPLEPTRHEVWGDQPDRPREKGFSIDPWTIVVWSAILLTALGYAAVSSWRTPEKTTKTSKAKSNFSESLWRCFGSSLPPLMVATDPI